MFDDDTQTADCSLARGAGLAPRADWLNSCDLTLRNHARVDGEDMLRHLIDEHPTIHVPHDLIDIDNQSISLAFEMRRLDARVDLLSLARPIFPHGLMPIHEAALHAVRPDHIRVHDAQRTIDVAMLNAWSGISLVGNAGTLPLVIPAQAGIQ